MTDQPDTSHGWCCNGKTWTEHAGTEGECCQPQGKSLEELPAEGRQLAEQRLGGPTRAEG